MLTLKSKVYLITSFFFILCCCFQFFNKLGGIVNIYLFAEITLFIIFLKYKKSTSWFIILFWVFFILATIAVFFHQDFTYSAVTATLKLLGYFMLLFYVCPKQKRIKAKRLDILVYSLVFFMNIYVVYKIIQLITPFVSSEYMLPFFFAYSIVLIVLYMCAYRYRLLYDSRSKYFLLLAVFLLLSEVVGVLAHFLDYRFLYYFEYFFYLFGLCFAVRTFIDKNTNDGLHKLIKTGNI